MLKWAWPVVAAVEVRFRPGKEIRVSGETSRISPVDFANGAAFLERFRRID